MRLSLNFDPFYVDFNFDAISLSPNLRSSSYVPWRREGRGAVYTGGIPLRGGGI